MPKKGKVKNNFYTAQKIGLIDIVDQQNQILNGLTPDDLIEGRNQN